MTGRASRNDERGPVGPLFSGFLLIRRWARSVVGGSGRLANPIALDALGADRDTAWRAAHQHSDGLEIRIPASLLPVLRVTNVVAGHRPLATHFAYPSHTGCPSGELETEVSQRADNYNRPKRLAQLVRPMSDPDFAALELPE